MYRPTAGTQRRSESPRPNRLRRALQPRPGAGGGHSVVAAQQNWPNRNAFAPVGHHGGGRFL
jgi:hypothetical protein